MIIKGNKTLSDLILLKTFVPLRVSCYTKCILTLIPHKGKIYLLKENLDLFRSLIPGGMPQASLFEHFVQDNHNSIQIRVFVLHWDNELKWRKRIKSYCIVFYNVFFQLADKCEYHESQSSSFNLFFFITIIKDTFSTTARKYHTIKNTQQVS